MQEIYTFEELKDFLVKQLEVINHEVDELQEQTKIKQEKFNEAVSKKKLAEANELISEVGHDWGVHLGKGMMLEKFMDYLGMLKNIKNETQELRN